MDNLNPCDKIVCFSDIDDIRRNATLNTKVEPYQSITIYMTIDEITEELRNEDLSPPDLAKIGTILAGFYSYYGQMLKRIHLKKPEIWLAIQTFEDWNGGFEKARAKPLSDKKTERMWEATKDGQKEIALEWECKRIEKMLSSINRRLYVDNQAAKNNY